MNKKRKERIENYNKLCVWSKVIRLRDDNQCQICGSKVHLNAHHIVPKEIKVLRFNLDNGVTLCAKCHRFGIYSAHKNGLYFSLWLQKVKPNQYDYLKSFLEPSDKVLEASGKKDEVK